MDCSSSGSSIHGIFQARVLEWGAIAFSDILITHNKNARRLKVKVAQPCPTLRPDGLQPSRLLCSSDSPGKNPAVGCYFLLQRNIPTQRSNLCLLHWQAAAAAKSRQVGPALGDPIDGSLPGSAVPGILQARVLKWAAVAFSGISRQIFYYCATW